MEIIILNDQFYIGSVDGIAAFVRSVPHGIRNYIALVCFLIAVDLASGVWTAFCRRNLRSRSLWDGFFRKLMQYSATLCIGAAAVVISESWWPISLIAAAIMAREVGSTIENIVRAQEGKNATDPFSKAVDFMGGFFAVSQPEKHTIVTTATMIPPHPDEQPAISTTATTTVSKPRQTNIQEGDRT